MNSINELSPPSSGDYNGPCAEDYWRAHALGIESAQQILIQNGLDGPLVEFVTNLEIEKSQLKAKLEHLAEVSHTDALTGVNNRRGIELAFEKLAKASSPANKRAYERSPEPTYLLFLDMDKFKEVNDEQGHRGGDELLARVAEILLANTREFTDTVGRLGGDEFIVLMPTAPEVRAIDTAEASRQEVRDRTGTSISIGVCKVDFSKSFIENLAQADNALYQAKAEGRDTVALYEPQLDPLTS